MSKTFYRAFEDRHRGSRELISTRLEAYLPFANPLKLLYPSCPVLDLGCGRGEWLELLQANGFSPRGVDLDEGMLEACWALELAAEHADALSALAALEDNSQVIVSAFHLVEHIPFDDVQKLVSEALRVLKPAGLLIMETPNAENLVVGTSSFFLDPTHERPLPLDLLSFLTEFSGFARNKVMRLQEDPALRESQQLSLMDVLGGTSPDYSVVAQKAATDEQLAIFDTCFDRGYGVSLESLAQRYEQQLQQRCEEAFHKFHLPELQEQLVDIKAELQQVRQQSSEAFEKFQLPALQEQSLQFKAELQQVLEQHNEAFEKLQIPVLQEQFVHLKAELQQIRLQHDEAFEKFQLPAFGGQLVEIQTELRHARRRHDDAQEKVDDSARQEQLAVFEAELLDIRQQRDEALAKAHEFWLKSCAYDNTVQTLTSSTSWRMTAPLRWSIHTVRTVPRAIANAIKNVPRRVMGTGIRFVLARPVLLKNLNSSLKRSPRLYNSLKSIAHNHGMVADATIAPGLMPDNSVPQHLDGLSVEARQIYQDLKKAVDQKDRG